MRIMHEKRGVMLYIAMITVSMLVLIAITFVNAATKAFKISSSARESVKSIYAADTGIECALMWDIRGYEPAFYGGAVFATSTDTTGGAANNSNLRCVGVDITSGGANYAVTRTGSFAETFFRLNFSGRCAEVTVRKDPNILVTSLADTTITSRGFNTACGVINDNTVERAIQVTY